jgi:hypothetical protein
MAHWPTPILEAVAKRLETDRPAIVVVVEQDATLRRALVNLLAEEAVATGRWSKRPVPLLTALLERPENVVVISNGYQLGKVAQGARLARNGVWLLIVEAEDSSTAEALADFAPLTVSVNLTITE